MTRLHRLLRDHPDAVEASLIIDCHLGDLPEDWRPLFTWRRLLVLIRHLPADSAVARALGDDWTLEHELLDEIRRDAIFIATKGKARPDPHPQSPAGRRAEAQRLVQAAKKARKRAESDERERARQARLAAKRSKGGAP